MTKQEVLDLCDQKISQSAVPFQDIKAAVDSIEIGGNVEELQAQIAALQAQMAGLQAQVDNLNNKIAQIRSIIG